MVDRLALYILVEKCQLFPLWKPANTTDCKYILRIIKVNINVFKYGLIMSIIHLLL